MWNEFRISIEVIHFDSQLFLYVILPLICKITKQIDQNSINEKEKEIYYMTRITVCISQ